MNIYRCDECKTLTLEHQYIDWGEGRGCTSIRKQADGSFGVCDGTKSEVEVKLGSIRCDVKLSED